MTVTDAELIRQYCAGSQDAFRELARRHLNLVFSAARRQMRSSTLAEEVTQSVFITLARDAGRIGSRTPLAAWLHTVTRHTAINAARTESRRQKREQTSVEISAMSSPTSDWSHVEPLLDEAVANLPATDRCAIILRFFEDKTLREVGETMGLTEEAARKRVSRALEQLRSLLLKRGVAVSSSALAADLTTHAIQVAPVGLSATVLSGVAVPAAGVAHAVFSTLAMTTMQKSLLVAIGMIAVGMGLYQARTISRQSSEIAQLREHSAALAQRQEADRRQRESAPAQREAVAPKPVAVNESAAADRKVIATMSAWADRAVRLRDLLKASSMWVVPEFRTLQEVDWLDVAKDAKLETDADVQNAFSRMRRAANQRVAVLVQAGLKAHANAKGGMLPTSAEELSPFIDSSVDPQMQLNPLSGPSLDLETQHFILRRILESDWFDKTLTRVADAQRGGTVGLTIETPANTNARSPTVSEALVSFNHALTQFQQRNNGQRPATEAQLEPFLSAPMNAALLRMLFEISQRPAGSK